MLRTLVLATLLAGTIGGVASAKPHHWHPRPHHHHHHVHCVVHHHHRVCR